MSDVTHVTGVWEPLTFGEETREKGSKYAGTVNTGILAWARLSLPSSWVRCNPRETKFYLDLVS